MKKKLLALAILCLSLVQVQAQEDDKLSRLMSDREQLILEYQYYNQQNSSFWGTQSKKDLISVIETLKKIINKDSELIGAVKEASIRKIAQSTVQSQREGKLTLEDQRNFERQISSLKSEVKIMEVAMKKREKTLADLQNQLESGEELRYGKDKVITVLAVAAFILLLYAIFLQVRVNSLKAKTVRRKKKV
ncbi:hypothetical protein [Pontibacter akesuensis]|uniref:Four helix bundle sensory module for signal transduction n=1 Tax=Pontibacter akesuensis TaxID=388950 RepID=A0A1I7G4S9_9BACT|nr:hypothetical protein [Pontibacter akesuensis]GHA58836.1 hypothetical protein GCM10007389_08460 [Pontibacter akesuensis]SFU43454.1 hypothetical protein SAMN04487941_0718 [Pontibacter akesuensis]